MKKLFSWLLSLIVALLLLVVILGAAGIWTANHYGPSFAASQVEKLTGFKLTIRSPHLRIQAGDINFEDVVLTNSKAFPDPDFLNIKQLAVKVEPKSLLSDTIVIDHAILDVEQVALVVSKDKKSNAIAFKDALPLKGGDDEHAEAKPATEDAPQEAGAKKEMLIKHIKIRLNKIKIADFSSISKVNQTVTLNSEWVFEDVRDLEEIIAPITKDLKDRGMELFAKYFAQQILSQPLGSVLNTAEGIIGTSAGAVDSAVGGILNVITSPFSKKSADETSTTTDTTEN